MKRYIFLLGIFFILTSCEKDNNPVSPADSKTAEIQIIIDNRTNKNNTSETSSNLGKAYKTSVLTQCEVHVLKSDDTPHALPVFLDATNGYFRGSVKVNAADNLKVLCIGRNNNDEVEFFGIASDVDAKPGEKTTADIKGWDSPYIPEIIGISPNPSTDGNYIFSWNAASNAESYEIREAKDNKFTENVPYVTSNLEYPFKNKVAGTYYYQVQSTNNYDNYNIKSGWSISASVVVQNTHTISGTVSGADDVTVTLSGDASGSMDVNDGGSYSFTVAESGNYTITPSKKGYSFTPPIQTFNNVSSEQVMDFSCIPESYTISGTITGADGVTVVLGGDLSHSKTVNDGDTYSFTVDGGGSYTVTPIKTGYRFNPTSSSFTEIISNHSQDFIAISSENNYTLSGTVSSAYDVTVTLSGDASGSQVVNDGSSYSFTVAEGGDYTITPSKTGYTFTPASQAFNNVTSDQTQNFTAIQNTWIISGTVSGADDVTVTLSGDASGSMDVNDGGSYSFTVAESGNYTITPSKTGYTFTPASQAFNNVSSDQTQNFTIPLITYTISGTVLGADGVTITLSGDDSGSLMVNDGGSYLFTVAGGGDYTVTPSKTGYTFTPASQAFNNVSSDQTQNFTTVQKTYTISGTVSGADGITVNLSGDATGSQVVNDGGSYSFTVTANGNYTVTPSKTGYTFTPASQAFNNVSSDQTQNFTTVQKTYTISGTVSGTDGITVNLSGDATGSQVVNDGGSYSFTVTANGNYTVTPAKSGYTFTPASKTFSNVKSNQTQDFLSEIISSQGKIAYVSLRDGNAEIYVMDTDGSNKTNLTNNPAEDMRPSYSPDGSKIVFNSNRGGGSREIFIMDADGSNPINLTNHINDDIWPSLSSDGLKITFASNRGGGGYDIFVMDADGLNQTNLTNNEAIDYISSFSPDGSKIVFDSINGSNRDIYVIDADGSNLTNLTNDEAKDMIPSYSPDGSKIVFSSDRGGDSNDIFVMDVDGSNLTNLTNDPAYDSYPSYSPDGSKIVFSSDRGGGFRDIFVMDADGSNPINLTNNINSNDYWPSWSPF
ncbi:hypothetical protein ACFL6P_06940 [Candidatus Latescibacterota bacterium]